jgi:hypothetical protein
VETNRIAIAIVPRNIHCGLHGDRCQSTMYQRVNDHQPDYTNTDLLPLPSHLPTPSPHTLHHAASPLHQHLTLKTIAVIDRHTMFTTAVTIGVALIGVAVAQDTTPCDSFDITTGIGRCMNITVSIGPVICSAGFDASKCKASKPKGDGSGDIETYFFRVIPTSSPPGHLRTHVTHYSSHYFTASRGRPWFQSSAFAQTDTILACPHRLVPPPGLTNRTPRWNFNSE